MNPHAARDLAGDTSAIALLRTAGAPQHILAVFEALQFQAQSNIRLAGLPNTDFDQLLEWCDHRQLTLMLPGICGSGLPAAVREQVLKKANRYAIRFERLKQELFDIVDAFHAANLEFVLLKGLSHAPQLTPDAPLRAQGDIDLWLPPSSVFKAQDMLHSLGYVSLLHSESRHLAPMARPSKWRWRGDLFDPDMPISVELHYELWSETAEYIAAPGLEQFWERKTSREFDGHKIHVLSEQDLLGFAALHLLLHLLHGELPLQRAWEIARFLHMNSENESFWNSWRSAHPIPLRRLETLVFRLVAIWFDCRLPQIFESEWKELPLAVQRWLDNCSLAPLIREWAPNKVEVWLHLALINDPLNRARVLVRRLVPIALPCFVDRVGSKVPSADAVWRPLRQLRLITARLKRHLATFLPTICDGLRLLWLRKDLIQPGSRPSATRPKQ